MQARINHSKDVSLQTSGTDFRAPTVVVILVGLICLGQGGFAQEAANPPEKSVLVGNAEDANMSPLPYIAEITGDDVHIRSGPGTNYYICGKLNKTDRVTVVDSQFGWSCILPPAGSFSWISAQYVSIDDAANPAIGTVTGDGVRVWVGSDLLRPIHSTTSRLKLNRGDKVRLMGEQQDGYHKIAPPDGAYRWVSTEYAKPIGPAGETVAVVATGASVEAEKLKEYYALEKQIQTELSKPIDQQDYANIKKALEEIAGNKEAGKAARYCKFAIKQVERCQLAVKVAKAVKLQDAQLQQIKEQIEQARATRLAELEDLGRFAVVGQLQASNIYDTETELKPYRITDNTGQNICYALPTGKALQTDLSGLIGRKVGLIGAIEPHLQTAGALVRFTEIVELK